MVAQDFGMDTNPRGKPLCPPPLPPPPARTEAITRLCSHFCTAPGSHFGVLTVGAVSAARPIQHPPSPPGVKVLCERGERTGGGSAGHGNTLPSPPFSHISVLLQQNWGGKGGRGARLGTHAGAGPSGKGQQPQQVWVTSPAALPGSNKNALGCGGVGCGGRRGRGQGRRGSGALTS